MKTKLTILLVLGLWTAAGVAQNQDPAPSQSTAATNEVVSITNAPLPAATLPPSPPLVVEAPPTPPAVPETTNSLSSATTTNALAESSAAQLPAEAAEIMPLVIFEEAPLFDVIKTLARQAHINFQFDPRIYTNYVGPDGKPVPEPVVSLRLENVTAQQVLESVLENYSYTLVPDPRTKISRVTFKDPKAPEPLVTKIVQLQYSSPSNMASVIRSIYTPPSRTLAIPDSRTSRLIVMTTAKEMEGLDQLILELDAPTRQVLIEARLFETSQNPQSIKGIDWSGTLEGQRFTFGNGLSSASTTTLLPGAPSTITLPSGRTITSAGGSSSATTISTPSGGTLSSPPGVGLNTGSGLTPNLAFLSADGVSAVLSFLNKSADTEVVAAPRAVTLDNETAVLSVTRAYPIFNITPGSANSPAGSQTLYTNLGTILTVTPRISGSNNIALKVVPEVSNIDSKDQQTVNGQLNVANIYAIRKVETHVIIPNAHTLVMGGLISDSVSKSHVKVPILGDLPGIGIIFRQDSKKRTKSNLLIFITPTILRDSDFQKQPATNFLQSEGKDNTDKPFSWWDSGTPRDWSRKDQ